MASLRDNFASNLRRLLAERELTSREFARRIGVAESVVSRWLNKQQFPQERHLEKIAAVLGCAFVDLVGGQGPAGSEAVIDFLREAAKARGYDLRKLT